MRIGLTVIACALLAATELTTAQDSAAIPAAVRLALDHLHPGWRLAAVSPEVRSFLKSELGRTPGAIVGDFDGDGRKDVALLIEYRNVEQPGNAFTHFTEAIAFLARDRGYITMQLQDRLPGPNPDLYLTLQKRGAQGFDFKANKKFVYPHDSIGLWYFGKAGGTFIYDSGKFRYVTESD